MRIFFARHGEYQNPDNIIPYRLPGFKLTENGRQQAMYAGETLVNEKIRTFSTSPIERCVETSEIISNIIHLHPNQKEALTETGTPLQGLTKIELLKMSVNYPYDVPAHIEGGGESPEMIFERMNNFVSKLKLMSKNSTHLIVSHGDPIYIYLIATLTKNIPHTKDDFENSGVRYIPMGGLILLEYGKTGIPTYKEII